MSVAKQAAPMKMSETGEEAKSSQGDELGSQVAMYVLLCKG